MKVLAIIDSNEYDVIRCMRKIKKLETEQTDLYRDYGRFLREHNLKNTAEALNAELEPDDETALTIMLDNIHAYDDQITSIRNKLKNKL